MARSKFFAFLVFFTLLLPVAASAEGLVVVVNPDSGVERLTHSEVINIFLGSFRQLPSGIVAIPVDLPKSHPGREEFYRQLVGKNPAEINAYWARLIFSGRTRPPIQAEQAEEAIALVQNVVGAITYLERSKVGGKLKIVFELPN